MEYQIIVSMNVGDGPSPLKSAYGTTRAKIAEATGLSSEV